MVTLTLQLFKFMLFMVVYDMLWSSEHIKALICVTVVDWLLEIQYVVWEFKLICLVLVHSQTRI
jgi:hypothetical protein